MLKYVREAAPHRLHGPHATGQSYGPRPNAMRSLNFVPPYKKKVNRPYCNAYLA